MKLKDPVLKVQMANKIVNFFKAITTQRKWGIMKAQLKKRNGGKLIGYSVARPLMQENDGFRPIKDLHKVMMFSVDKCKAVKLIVRRIVEKPLVRREPRFQNMIEINYNI